VLDHWSHSPALFAFVCSDRVLHFLPGLASDCNSTYASHIAGITGLHHNTWPETESLGVKDHILSVST
jgi:hypothetical protein